MDSGAMRSSSSSTVSSTNGSSIPDCSLTNVCCSFVSSMRILCCSLDMLPPMNVWMKTTCKTVAAALQLHLRVVNARCATCEKAGRDSLLELIDRQLHRVAIASRRLLDLFLLCRGQFDTYPPLVAHDQPLSWVSGSNSSDLYRAPFCVHSVNGA